MFALMEPARFPAFSAEALDGTAYVAPRDFAGARNVIVVGFALEQRGEIESWGRYLDALVRGRSDVRARLYALLGGGAKMMRGVILSAMRKALPQPELRASTIVHFTDVDAFCRAAGITDRKHLALFVVDPDGAIAWRGSGAYSGDTAASIDAALVRA